jgi:hypothetical protein
VLWFEKKFGSFGDDMGETINWDQLADGYTMEQNFLHRRVFITPEALQKLIAPTEEDIDWLIQALGHAERKWFVAELFRVSEVIPESLFLPVMDAAINEIDPSNNKYFVEPCMKTFGPRRVNEYLLEVVSKEENHRKAGAVNALYWAGVLLRNLSYEDLSDLWMRKRILFLETFVLNSDVDIQRSLISKLNVNSMDYPKSHQHMVTEAISIARESKDEYIRHRIEVQLGNEKFFKPIPHRNQA